jgi:hypothetical protein
MIGGMGHGDPPILDYRSPPRPLGPPLPLEGPSHLGGVSSTLGAGLVVVLMLAPPVAIVGCAIGIWLLLTRAGDTPAGAAARRRGWVLAVWGGTWSAFCLIALGLL